MLFFNKSQKNNIKNRTIFLRHFPDTEEIQKMDAVKRMIWLKLDDIKFSRLGNVITISREQAESSKIMDIVSFVSEMSTEKNIEKIIENNPIDKKKAWIYSIIMFIVLSLVIFIIILLSGIGG